MPAAPPFRLGLFAISRDTYWTHFQYLKERLAGYIQVAEANLAAIHPPVVNLGLVDTTAAGSRFGQAEFDIIFFYVSPYALSSTVPPVVQRAKVPVISLNLAPAAAITYVALNALADRTAACRSRCR